MDVFEAIDKRYSYRGAFKDQPVPRGDIEKVLMAGIRAPSGLNTQTTSFIAVTNPQLRAALNTIMPKPGMATAPLVIVVLSEKVNCYAGTDFEMQDFSAAAENMLLAITALGYASVWIEGQTKDEGRQEKIAKLLGVPAGQTVRVVMPVGLPEQPGTQKEKKPFGQRAKILE